MEPVTTRQVANTKPAVRSRLEQVDVDLSEPAGEPETPETIFTTSLN